MVLEVFRVECQIVSNCFMIQIRFLSLVFPLSSIVVVFLLPITASAQTACPQITKRLTLNSVDSQVVTLKRYLTGIGLMGPNQFTTYFGPLTQTALKKWQCQKGIVCSGTPNTTGYGVTGPKTRAALRNCAATPPQPPLPPPTPLTNTWVTTPWSTCTNAQQTRSVSCVANNQTVADSFCAASKPATTQSCTPLPQCIPLPPQTRTESCPQGQVGYVTQTSYSLCPGPTWFPWVTTASRCTNLGGNTTYSWIPGAWSACVNEQETRSVTCVSSTGQTVVGNLCTTAQPATTQGCTESTASCTFNGQTILHGVPVTAYNIMTVTTPDTCAQHQETRTCTNGTLSGSYTYVSCSSQQLTYSWITGAWSTCNSGQQTRSVTCQSSTGQTVADSLCTAVKPGVTQSCTLSNTIPQGVMADYNYLLSLYPYQRNYFGGPSSFLKLAIFKVTANNTPAYLMKLSAFEVCETCWIDTWYLYKENGEPWMATIPVPYRTIIPIPGQVFSNVCTPLVAKMCLALGEPGAWAIVTNPTFLLGDNVFFPGQ